MAIEAGGAPLAERLRGLLARRARGEEAAELATFARLLFARGGGYAEELAPEEAAALVASAFRFFSAPGPELRVRAVTPEYASDGWDASVSVIETVMPDRAFIVDTIRSRLERAGVPVLALLHPIFATRRDPSGRLELLTDPEGGTPRESFTHVAIPRSTDRAALACLEADIRDALEAIVGGCGEQRLHPWQVVPPPAADADGRAGKEARHRPAALSTLRAAIPRVRGRARARSAGSFAAAGVTCSAPTPRRRLCKPGRTG